MKVIHCSQIVRVTSKLPYQSNTEYGVGSSLAVRLSYHVQLVPYGYLNVRLDTMYVPEDEARKKLVFFSRTSHRDYTVRLLSPLKFRAEKTPAIRIVNLSPVELELKPGIVLAIFSEVKK